MEITEAQFKRIAPLLPKQRRNVSVPNLQVLNAILHVAGLQVARPAEALWQLAHDLHANEPLGQERPARPGVRAAPARPAHPHQGRGAWTAPASRCTRTARGLEKNGPQSIGKSRGGWNTQIHMVAADARTAVAFTLSPGNAHDAPQGRKLMSRLQRPVDATALVMDKAYEDNATRQLALDLGFDPVVPPKSNRVDPSEYNQEMYKRRNEAPVPTPQGLPAHLLPLREAGRHVPRLHRLRAHH